jgi:hypothetical protein
MNSPAVPALRSLVRIRGVALVLALAAGAQAQQPLVGRYFIRSDDYTAAGYQALRQRVTVASIDVDERTGVVADLYYPGYRLSAVAAVLTPEQVQRLNQDPTMRVRSDTPLRPVATPAGSGWPLNQWMVPEGVAACAQTAPVVYLVDTGVAAGHTDFDYAPGAVTLSFLPGVSFGYDYTTLPAVLIPPTTDPHDHGTRVAGCLGGRTSGLLGPLGGRAQLQSILIYDVDPGFPLATYASQAIQGILAAVTDHQARKAQPYLKNHASVLVFPHTTVAADGRIADLDQTIEVAWQEGLHVVLAAGNEGVPAVEVSPAGAAWGYVDGGGPTRFFFGAKPPGAVWFRAAEEFLVAGGFKESGSGLALSALSNVNAPGADAVDVFAPGEAIPCPSAAGPGVFVTGAGTSLSAGFTAAMVAWSAFERPWVRTSQGRGAVRAAATTAFGFPKAETPGLPASLSYRQWMDHFYPEPAFPPGDRDPLADPDGDGVANFIEYHCGQDPRFGDAAIRPEISLSPSPSGSTIGVSMPTACHLGSPGLVTWELQTSTDLVNWEPASIAAPAPADPVVEQGDGILWRTTAAGPSAPPGTAWFRIRFFATASLW